MRRHFFRYLFITLLVIPTLPSRAQTPGKTEEKEIFFMLNYVLRHNDTVVAMLSGAFDMGIQKGNLVNAYRIHKLESDPNSKNDDFIQVGSGRIVKADSMIFCLVKLKKESDTLAVGDLVSLKVNAPAISYRSIFSDLAFNKIFFTDYHRESVYTIRDIWNTDSKQKEDSLFAVMLKDLHNTYDSVKNRPNLPPQLTDKIKGGRYAGKTSLELIRDATRADLNSFLLYVYTYPAGYRARDYRLSESFAGWAAFGGPYSPSEIKNALLPIHKNEKAFLKQLPVYRNDIVKNQYLNAYFREVEELIAKNKLKEARELDEFAKTLTYAVNDTGGKAMAWLYEAEIDHSGGDFFSALKKCDSSLRYSILAGSKEYELNGISKKVYCLNKTLQFGNSKNLLKEWEIKLEQYKSGVPAEVYDKMLQNRYEYEGVMNYDEGNYDLALANFGKLIAINKSINTYSALVKNADYYAFIGRVNNAQGKPKNALDSFFLAARIYKTSFDTLNWAKTQNDMAYSYFLLSDYRKSMAYCDSAMQNLVAINDPNDAGYSKSLIGSSYWNLGKYDSAVLAHKESISLRKKANNLGGQANSWKNIGELYLLSGLKSQALMAYDTAAFFYQQIKDSSGLTETYNKKGMVYYNDDSYKKAITYFEKAKEGNSKATVEALYNLGSAWESIDTAKARKYYEESRALSSKTANTNYLFFSTKALATLAYNSGNTEKGDKLYTECLNLSRELKTPASAGYCQSLKAYRYESKTQLDSALFYYEKAMAIFDTVDRDQYIWQLNYISSVYLSTGEFAKANAVLTKAIKQARENSNNLALGTTLQRTTFLYGLTAEYEKGLNDNDSAIRIFSRSGNMVRLANTYGSRGTLLTSMGKFREAINAFAYADSIYADELLTESRGVVFNNIGNTYLSQLDYPNALRYFQRSLDLLPKDLVNESALLVKGNIAECLYGQKKTAEAKKLFLEILPKARDLKLNRIASGMALILGKIYEEENNIPEALAYFTYAREYAAASGEQEKLVEALIHLGKINTMQGNDEPAMKNLRNAVLLGNTFKTINGWNALYELGLLFYNQKKFDSAVAYFKQAVELLDKNAENLYGGDEARKLFNNDPKKSDLYNKITFSYYNVGNIREAWAYANRSNIAGIKELSGSLSTSSNDEARNEALKKLLALQQSKKALENTLTKQEGTEKEETIKKIEIVEADYNNFLQDVVTQYPDLGTYFSRSNADEFNNYKSKLDADVAVLLYLLNNNTLMIFSLTHEKLAVDTMTIDLNARVKTFISAIKNIGKSTGTGPLVLRSEPVDEDKKAGNAEFKDVSNELYRILIATVADKIVGKKKICVIPTGIFSNMPFQCLGEKTKEGGFHFLIEDYPIFYTNKMSIFNSGKEEGDEKKNFSSFAAFGVPDENLSFNIAEVKEIGKILRSDSTVYTDARATESMAKQSLRQKKYIHFATHGVLNYSSDYSQSYLKLLPDKDTTDGNNGKLTMREIQRLGITDCKMVILSACQTAVSSELVKGWSISPANSFLVSNVKTVVASLWKVSDEPTGLLMQYFYENLAQEKPMEKAEALRQAQIRLSQDPRFHHPNYWGAFVLYGDWR